MNLFFTNIILPLVWSIVLLNVAFVIGRAVLERLRLATTLDRTMTWGASVLVGYGLISYVVLLTTLLAPLSKVAVIIFCVGVLGLGYKKLCGLCRELLCVCKSTTTLSTFDKILVGTGIFFFLFYLTSAMVPPYRIDALAYHLPEVVHIASYGVLTMGGFGNFYENLPKLMETLYALPYVLSGFTLISLVHYQMLLAGMVCIFGFVKKEFNVRAALLSIVLVFTLYDLLVNATSQFIDGATIAYEITACLLFIGWLKYGQRHYLVLTGMMYGFALGVKYVPMYSFLLVLILFFVQNFIRRIGWRTVFNSLIYLVIPALVCCGFWYLKNLIIVHNPVYPFIFGHKGFSLEALVALDIAIKQYVVPRTVLNFVLLPIKLFLTPYYLPVVVAFFAVPFAYFIKSNRAVTRTLLYFVVMYFGLWFFAISHQKRFSMFGSVLLMVVGAICVQALIEKYATVFFSRYFLVFFGLVCFAVGYGIITYKNNYFLNVKKAEVLYIIGSYSTQDFYTEREKNIAAVYALSNYINGQFTNTAFLNLWDATGFFLKHGNTFVPPLDFGVRGSDVTSRTLKTYFSEKNIHYVVTYAPAARLAYQNDPEHSTNPADVDYAKNVLSFVYKIEDFLPTIATIVYNDGQRLVYRIN